MTVYITIDYARAGRVLKNLYHTKYLSRLQVMVFPQIFFFFSRGSNYIVYLLPVECWVIVFYLKCPVLPVRTYFTAGQSDFTYVSKQKEHYSGVCLDLAPPDPLSTTLLSRYWAR